MLEQHTLLTPQRPSIQLELQNQPLAKFLSHLLQEWGYQLTDQPQGDDLLLCDAAPGEMQLVLQTGDNRQFSAHALPLNLPLLYKTLDRQWQQENQQYQMRINICQPLTVKFRGEEIHSETRSLSDRGMRFSLPLELSRGEHLELQLLLGERKYHLTGEVFYVLPGKELGWGERVDIGVCFKPLAHSTRQYILNWILGCYLQRMQLLMDSRELQIALSLLQLPPSSLGMLKKPLSA